MVYFERFAFKINNLLLIKIRPSRMLLIVLDTCLEVFCMGYIQLSYFFPPYILMANQDGRHALCVPGGSKWYDYSWRSSAVLVSNKHYIDPIFTKFPPNLVVGALRSAPLSFLLFVSLGLAAFATTYCLLGRYIRIAGVAVTVLLLFFFFENSEGFL